MTAKSKRFLAGLGCCTSVTLIKGALSPLSQWRGAQTVGMKYPAGKKKTLSLPVSQPRRGNRNCVGMPVAASREVSDG